jgi:hypothetical protein
MIKVFLLIIGVILFFYFVPFCVFLIIFSNNMDDGINNDMDMGNFPYYE